MPISISTNPLTIAVFISGGLFVVIFLILVVVILKQLGLRRDIDILKVMVDSLQNEKDGLKEGPEKETEQSSSRVTKLLSKAILIVRKSEHKSILIECEITGIQFLNLSNLVDKPQIWLQKAYPTFQHKGFVISQEKEPKPYIVSLSVWEIQLPENWQELLKEVLKQ